jgi:hypothetical protein
VLLAVNASTARASRARGCTRDSPVEYLPRRQTDHGWPGTRSRPRTRCGRHPCPKLYCHRYTAGAGLGTIDMGPSPWREPGHEIAAQDPGSACALPAASPKPARPKPPYTSRVVAIPAIPSFIDRRLFRREQGRLPHRKSRFMDSFHCCRPGATPLSAYSATNWEELVSAPCL